MIIGYRSKILPLSDDKLGNGNFGSSEYAVFQRPCRVRWSHSTSSSICQSLCRPYLLQDGFKDAKERIRKTFQKVELSPSSYDTAWVAMVPSRHSVNQPCFPQCLDWILENQSEDGSWGLNPSHPLLVKDSLSSTLACLLALRKWGVGDNQVQRGLGYIEKHGWAVDDKDQISPVGFEVIFPSMIKIAEKHNLNLPLDPGLVYMAIRKRDATIERALQNNFTGNVGNLEYVAEGLGELCQWKKMMVHQRQNGSLFDSPSTTAAALIYHQHDEKCFGYLNSILKLHKNWVPTIYPMKVHSLLCLVDTLQCLGVDRYFNTEIKDVLDEIYRLWQQKTEEIFSNVADCAMAFRLLRMSNYEVSSEELAEFLDEEHFFATNGKIKSYAAIFELHKASQLAVDEKDHILDKISNWTGIFLEQKLLNNDFLDSRSKKEVELAIKKFYVTYNRVENRRCIESYEENNFKILKAAYRSPSINNKDLFIFSRNDFDLGVARYQEELQQLKRWYEDCRLEHVGLPQEYIYRSHLISIAVLFEHEFSDARLMYAKYTMLLTLIDDLFDVLASKDELRNIIELVERWDGYASIGFHSERVKVFFSAFYNTMEDLAAKAEIRQGRSVKDHLNNLWVEVLKCNLVQRLDWWTSNKTLSVEEYLSATSVTFGAKCFILTTQYFVGIKIPKDLLGSADAEIDGLCNCSGTLMRLLNDLQSYKRERAERTSNLVSVLMMQSPGTISEQEAIRQGKEMVETNRRKLLRMVVQGKGSQLPQVCKDLFWRTAKVVHFVYSNRDEYRSPKEMKNHINDVIYKPLYRERSMPAT